ncbi:DNA replication/repair protein RecF [Perlucidibaca aquatica]|uniref:DNA replication/repair protein RecF n=1 Tax=Perlucidibaca aquatica TaxID=1852776 RepID=UPI00083B10A4|nr:DNA replication/repair protein RecF [Perlucidibaca aquatica]
MSLAKLDVVQLRNLEHVSIEPGSRFNLIYGENGSGKSSLLEAIFVLGLGRSFRTQRARRIVQDGHDVATVFAELANGSRLGVLKRSAGITEARVNGHNASALSELAQHLPLQLFDPESLLLISGPSLARRQLLDWGVFHVEPEFLAVWSRAKRALAQRNSLLKSAKISIPELKVWELELAAAANELSCQRRALATQLLPELERVLSQYLPASDLTVSYYAGWEETLDYSDLLEASRSKDRERGFTVYGPHRADLKIRSHGTAADERLSRGQLKLCACLVKLVLSQWLQSNCAVQPVFLFDDLSSELDTAARLHIAEFVGAMSVQSFFTSIDKKQLEMTLPLGETKMFHVEHGAVSPVQN